MSEIATRAQEEAVERSRSDSGRERFIVPPVNVRETGEAIHLEAEMPGVKKDGLEVTLQGTELTIVGHKSTAEPEGEPHFRESRPFKYRRVFELDPNIDTDKISAEMDQGVLKLTLPKGEKAKPRKIKVS